jgi:hypothetical protein
LKTTLPFFAVAVVVGLSVVSCGRGSPDTVTSAYSSELRTALSGFDLENPASDVEKALARGDRRLMGYMGFSCSAPGTDIASLPVGFKWDLNCIPGTSDVLIKGEETLREQALTYARTYNAELLRRVAQ